MNKRTHSNWFLPVIWLVLTWLRLFVAVLVVFNGLILILVSPLGGFFDELFIKIAKQMNGVARDLKRL